MIVLEAPSIRAGQIDSVYFDKLFSIDAEQIKKPNFYSRKIIWRRPYIYYHKGNYVRSGLAGADPARFCSDSGS